MKMRYGAIPLLVLGLSWAALAQGSSPMRQGQWEITSKLTIPGMGEAPPMKQQQCVTAAMIQDPQSAIPKMDNDCRISNYKLEASTATYTMTCTQPTALTATGEIKYAGTDAYTGTVKLDSMGQTLTMVVDAKRVGECPK